MKISNNKLKNVKVYFCDEDEPFGVFSDTIIDRFGKISGYAVKTMSIVPITKIIKIDDTEKIVDGRLILSKSAVPENSECFKRKTDSNFVYSDSIKSAVCADEKPKKLKDIRFDTETGEICDVVVLKNIIAGKEKISVNKIYAKDNTIYIDKKN